MASRALLISTYDLGHQPFGLASPAAWLRRVGLEVRCVDLAQNIGDERVRVGRRGIVRRDGYPRMGPERTRRR